MTTPGTSQTERTGKSAPRLVLASSSPRRKMLLSQAGLEFALASPPLEEPGQAVVNLAPRQQAESLAYFKSRSVGQHRPEDLVLGADTIVAVGDEVLGKPANDRDARRMLRMLSGTCQQVITGVALVYGWDRWIASAVTDVTMRPIDDGEIEAYIASGEWVGKAGAYAIQESGDQFVTDVDGPLDNVIGLPVELVTQMLGGVERYLDHRTRNEQ